jgi:hypothetical protein
MNQTEHLNLILSRCRDLLAIAAKRTPGRWSVDENITGDRDMIKAPMSEDCRGYILTAAKTNNRNEADFAFIASAAGPFEASLRSTIVAINRLTDIELSIETDGIADEAIDEIIAAWQLELFK